MRKFNMVPETLAQYAFRPGPGLISCAGPFQELPFPRLHKFPNVDQLF